MQFIFPAKQPASGGAGVARTILACAVLSGVVLLAQPAIVAELGLTLACHCRWHHDHRI